jgi:hypothetical protein
MPYSKVCAMFKVKNPDSQHVLMGSTSQRRYVLTRRVGGAASAIPGQVFYELGFYEIQATVEDPLAEPEAGAGDEPVPF